MSAVMVLELDHEKVLANGAVASKIVPVETRHLVILCNTTGPVVDGGLRRVEDCGWSECPQDREEMGKDDHLQAVGVPGRGRVR
jgi:hypothetical protein